MGGDRRWIRRARILGLLVSCVACQGDSDPARRPGRPLHELSEVERGRFQQGKAIFTRVFGPDEGLGPFFNENACNACHSHPTNGGTGEQRLVQVARSDESGDCRVLSPNVRQQTTPALAMHGLREEPVPAGATDTVRFMAPFLFGLGLVEAIPADAILARADPMDEDDDGISGRPGAAPDGRVGRFGHRAERATLPGFIDTALRLEMGLTTPSNPVEALPAGLELPSRADPVAEPEIGRDAVALLADYVRFLAPPARRVPETAEQRARVARGEQIFHRIGCPACHVPAMRTGPSQSPALDETRVHLYSDLLLHDLGPGLAGACTAHASASEFRTAPLMGLRYRDRFLHDGRAFGIRDAIELHGGEAAATRSRFEALGTGAQALLLMFLEAL